MLHFDIHGYHNVLMPRICVPKSLAMYNLAMCTLALYELLLCSAVSPSSFTRQ